MEKQYQGLGKGCSFNKDYKNVNNSLSRKEAVAKTTPKKYSISQISWLQR